MSRETKQYLLKILTVLKDPKLRKQFWHALERDINNEFKIMHNNRQSRKIGRARKRLLRSDGYFKRKRVFTAILRGSVPVGMVVGVLMVMANKTEKNEDKKLLSELASWGVELKNKMAKNELQPNYKISEEVEIKDNKHLQSLLKEAKKRGYNLDEVDIDPECHIVISRENCGEYKEGIYKHNGKEYCRAKPQKPSSGEEYSEIGMISYYEGSFVGRKTSTGSIFTGKDPTGAHRTFPIPSLAIVTNLENGREVLVMFTDGGPFGEYYDKYANEKRERVADVSGLVADKLGFRRKGTTRAQVTYQEEASDDLKKFVYGEISREEMQATVNRIEYQVAVDNFMNEITIAMSKELKGQRASLEKLVEIYNTSVACYNKMDKNDKDFSRAVLLAENMLSEERLPDTFYYPNYAVNNTCYVRADNNKFRKSWTRNPKLFDRKMLEIKRERRA